MSSGGRRARPQAKSGARAAPSCRVLSALRLFAGAGRDPGRGGVGARATVHRLDVPEMVESGRPPDDARAAQSLLEERHLLIATSCARPAAGSARAIRTTCGTSFTSSIMTAATPVDVFPGRARLLRPGTARFQPGDAPARWLCRPRGRHGRRCGRGAGTGRGRHRRVPYGRLARQLLPTCPRRSRSTRRTRW